VRQYYRQIDPQPLVTRVGSNTSHAQHNKMRQSSWDYETVTVGPRDPVYKAVLDI
jgi:hypothetical protein